MMRSPVIRFSPACRLAKLHIGPWRSGQGPAPLFSHTLKRSVILGLLLFFLAFCAGGHALANDAYLGALIDEATKQRLAESREWHLLLHYRSTLWGGYESEQDDPGFFLSDSGKTDPEAELRATLAQFFSQELVGRSQQPAQCAFIARYHWLRERLAFDPAQLPAQVCDRFNRWYEEFEAESITLIFPSAFLNNPASMFGHTLLRVDQKGQTEQTRILAYTINYAAEVPKDAGIAYPVKGIFGGYRGYFSTIPYYLKVQEYRDIENRDIWEYRLQFTQEQIRRLLMHAWELGNAYFDYFFFKENCSYHLLALLDFADPTLHLTEEFHFWTIPADTVRLIASKPGLVSGVAYRPSRSNVIRRKREFLPSTERRLAEDIADDVGNLASPALGRLAIGRQAFVLDLASDLLRYRIDKKDSPPELKERNREVLTVRSQLRIPSEPFTVVPFAKQPEIGHRTSRASMGAGWRNDDTFEEVSVRAGYHDLLDPEAGYTPDAQIEMGSITARHYNRADQTRIERATLANIVSLIPIDSVFHAPSWKVNIGMQTIRNQGCRLCSNGFLNTGVGAAVESRWLKREVWFAFAEAEANYSPAYEERHRIGGGGTAGLLADVTERWKIMATGSYLRYALGEQTDDIRWFVGSRLTLTRNWALRVEYNHRHHDDDVVFSVQAFF